MKKKKIPYRPKRMGVSAQRKQQIKRLGDWVGVAYAREFWVNLINTNKKKSEE